LARWVPAPLRPALTSRKTLARVIAGMLASGAAVALMIAFDDVDASAAVTVTCSVSDPTMTVSVSDAVCHLGAVHLRHRIDFERGACDF
jgi:hypothetical protein